jgi:hypothetical protein
MPIKAKVSERPIKALKELLKELKKPIDKATAEAVGDAIVSGMLEKMARGQSPIKGYGPFPAYKDPKKYPGDRKPKRPVNLYLDGDFWNSLTRKAKRGTTGYDTVIFYQGKENDKKEQGHREGANGQPKRPTLPRGNQTFAESIRIAFTKIYRQRLKDLKAKAKGK